MGNTQSKFKRKSNKLKVVKLYIKFLAVAPDLEVVKAVITKAPKEVIAAISNAALNGRQGAVHISRHLIPLFQRHKHNCDYLVNRRKSIPSKRHLITAEGWCSSYYCSSIGHSSWLTWWRIYFDGFTQ